MHEEPYAQAILELVLERAGGQPVTAIRLGVGRFSTVVPASLEMFFSHLSQGTPAEGAQLVFEIIPLALTCRACQATLTLDIPPHQPVQPVLATHLQAGCRCGQKQLRPSGGLTVELISVSGEFAFRARKTGSKRPFVDSPGRIRPTPHPREAWVRPAEI